MGGEGSFQALGAAGWLLHMWPPQCLLLLLAPSPGRSQAAAQETLLQSGAESRQGMGTMSPKYVHKGKRSSLDLINSPAKVSDAQRSSFPPSVRRWGGDWEGPLGQPALGPGKAEAQRQRESGQAGPGGSPAPGAQWLRRDPQDRERSVASPRVCQGEGGSSGDLGLHQSLK